MLSTSFDDISQSRCRVMNKKVWWTKVNRMYTWNNLFLLHRNQPLRCCSSRLSRSLYIFHLTSIFSNTGVFHFSHSNPGNVDWIFFHKILAGPWDEWAETVAGSEEKSLRVRAAGWTCEKGNFCLFFLFMYLVFLFCLCILSSYFVCVFCLYVLSLVFLSSAKKTLRVLAADGTCKKGQQRIQTFKV